MTKLEQNMIHYIEIVKNLTYKKFNINIFYMLNLYY